MIMFAINSKWDQHVQQLKFFEIWTDQLEILSSMRYSWLWLLRSCCASNVKSDLALVEMVHVHERLTLIILTRDVTWHLKGKPAVWLKLLPHWASSKDGLQIFLELLMLLWTEVKLFPRANWLLTFVPWLIVWESCRCSFSSPSS